MLRTDDATAERMRVTWSVKPARGKGRLGGVGSGVSPGGEVGAMPPVARTAPQNKEGQIGVQPERAHAPLRAPHVGEETQREAKAESANKK